MNWVQMAVVISHDGSDKEKEMFENRGVNITPHIRKMNTCLLYTSPSPRDRTRSRMPSSA